LNEDNYCCAASPNSERDTMPFSRPFVNSRKYDALSLSL
jgi:hypothetical protein